MPQIIHFDNLVKVSSTPIITSTSDQEKLHWRHSSPIIFRNISIIHSTEIPFLRGVSENIILSSSSSCWFCCWPYHTITYTKPNRLLGFCKTRKPNPKRECFPGISPTTKVYDVLLGVVAFRTVLHRTALEFRIALLCYRTDWTWPR